MEKVVFVPRSEELAEAADDATAIVVDIEAAGLTTRTLNALLAARSRLLARGGTIAVVVSPRQRRVLGLLGLDRRFFLAADRRQALEALGLFSAGRASKRRPLAA